jgi:hypothetical protein
MSKNKEMVDSTMVVEEQKDQNMENNEVQDSEVQENHQSHDLNIQEIERNWIELAKNIQVKIFQCRSMLMAERGKNQLDGKKHKQRKIAIRKEIARLQSIITNPHSLHKALKNMNGYKQLIEAQMQAIKDSTEGQNNLDAAQSNQQEATNINNDN